MGNSMQAWKDKIKKQAKLLLPIVVILAGAFILFSNHTPENKNTAEAEKQEETEVLQEEEKKLSEILSKISGAGQVSVMLTIKNQGSVEYQVDSQKSLRGEEDTLKTETVFYSDGSSREKPLICSTNMPEYLGALIVCQGGDKATTRLNITKAVCALTGLTSDKITILKMK